MALHCERVHVYENNTDIEEGVVPMKTSTGAVLVTGASSGMGKVCALFLDQAGYTVFAGVRYALESINDALRVELRPWGIHVVLVAPGSIRTPAVDKLVQDSEAMLKTFSPEGTKRYATAYRAFVQTFVKQHEAGAPPEVMAHAVLEALTARTPRARYPVGPLSRRLPLLACWLPPRVFDRVKARLFGLRIASYGI
jgi:NAD(P)-dependent dehydrogenase (short-subunit alcohol dehydrogenase family)